MTVGEAQISNGGRISQDVGLWVLVATILGSSMAFIDGTVVNVALPVLQTDLNATAVQAQWVMEAYALFLAALILVGGSMGDHFGRRRIFGIGIVIFAGASVWCGLAPSATQLILARAVQGVGGAMLVPGSLAIITAYFDEARRGRAIGMWSAFSAITTAFGPVLGGWLVENASWRWVFFINIPIAAIVLVVLFWRVPESSDGEDVHVLDWWGAVLATLGLGGITFGLVESSNLGWGHALIVGSLVGGVAAFVGFLWVESRAKVPMMPLSLYKSATFSGANLFTLLLYGALSGALFYFPFNLIQVQGYSATAAGAAFLPFTLILAGLSTWAGGLIQRYGAKWPLVVGSLIVGLGYYLFSLPGIGGSYWATYFPGVVTLGLGMAIVVAPLTTAVMSSVGVERSGIASGVNNAFARTAGLMAIAVFGVFVFNAFNRGLDTRLSDLNMPAEAEAALDEERIKLAGAAAPAALDAETRGEVESAIDQAFLDGFRLSMYVSVGLAVASALIAFLMIEGKKTEEEG